MTEVRTAEQFLEHIDVEVNEENLFHLTVYTGSSVDFVAFPDADVYSEDGYLIDDRYEPAGFINYLKIWK